jgi:hypothetical protein
MTDSQDVHAGPLSEDEVKQIRRIIRDEDRMRWLWATVRIWSAWLSAGIVGAYGLYEIGMKFLKK